MNIRLSVPTLTGGLIAGHVYFGVGYLTGGPRVFSSRTFTYALQVLDGRTWALLILLGAVASILAPWSQRVSGYLAAVMHVLAGLPLAVFAGFLFFAEIDGLSQGWGGSMLFLIPAVIHARIAAARIAAQKESA